MESLKKAASLGFSSDGAEDTEIDLVNCNNCGRHFAADRIQTHEWICQKQKKRKPFDVCQQRVKGTDAEKFYKKNKTRIKSEVRGKLGQMLPITVTEKVSSPPQNQKSWRKQHEEFIMSMKAAREMSAILKKGGNLRDLPPPPRSDYSDYIQCPTCLRKFNSTAAERHIPKCAEMQLKKPKAPAQKPAPKNQKPKEMPSRGKK